MSSWPTHTHIHITEWWRFTVGLSFRGLLLVSVLSLTTPSAVCVCVRSGGVKRGRGRGRTERGSWQPCSWPSTLQAELVTLRSEAKKTKKRQIVYCGCDCCMGVKNGNVTSAEIRWISLIAASPAEYFFVLFCNGFRKSEMRTKRPPRSLFWFRSFSLNLRAREEHGGFLRGLLALQFLSQPHTFRNLQFKKRGGK